MSRAVVEVFVRLHEQGLIYRGKRLVNWDPVLGTAVSDLEVDSEEEDGKLWDIRYPLEDGTGGVVVATTRPETMLGDVAVAVHPGRRALPALIGKRVRLPLTGRTIPVIADDYVDPEFGTGCVKITPAHDFNDYQVWLRHKDGALKDAPHGGLISIFKLDARLKESDLDDFSRGHGASPVAARRLMVKVARVPLPTALIPRSTAASTASPRARRSSRILPRRAPRSEKPYKLRVPRSGRTEEIVEPMLTDQWFVRMDGLAAERPRGGRRRAT